MSIQEAAGRHKGSERVLKDGYPPEISHAGKIIAYYDLFQFHLSNLYDFLLPLKTNDQYPDAISDSLEILVSSYRRINHIVSIIVNHQKSSRSEKSKTVRYLFEVSGRLRVDACILSKDMLSFAKRGILNIEGDDVADGMMFIVDYDSASSIMLDYFLSLYHSQPPDISIADIDTSALLRLSPKPQSFLLHDRKRAEGNVNKKNHTHPGILIAGELAAVNLTVAEAAEKLGMTRNQLHRIIRGDSDISQQTAIQLDANGFGPSAREWLILQLDFNLAKQDAGNISRIGRPTAGQPRKVASLRR